MTPHTRERRVGRVEDYRGPEGALPACRAARVRRPALAAFAAWACVVVVTSLAQNVGAQDAGEIVRRVQRRYDATRAYSADFHQTAEYRTLGRRIAGRGRFYFSRPGKMLWDYKEPAGQFVLFDGRHIYFYQPAERQVIKTAARAAFRSDLPVSFLLGIGSLERDFRAELLESSGGLHQLKLTPNRANTGVREIVLVVDSGSHDIRQLRIEDGAGNHWTFGFENIRRGAGLDPSLFRLKIPQGVDIVEFGS